MKTIKGHYQIPKPEQEPKPKPNAIMRLLHKDISTFPGDLFEGDISLPVTYWVFGTLIAGGVSTILLTIVEMNYFDIVTKSYGPSLIQAVSWFVLALWAFMCIAVWRSAGKYQGSRFWALAARTVVIIGVITTAANLLLLTDSQRSLDRGIELLSRDLPKMLDNGTRLDSVWPHPENEEGVWFVHTLVKVTVDGINIAAFNSRQKVAVSRQICNAEPTRTALNGGAFYRYSYNDRNNAYVTNFTVTSADCP